MRTRSGVSRVFGEFGKYILYRCVDDDCILETYVFTDLDCIGGTGYGLMMETASRRRKYVLFYWVLVGLRDEEDIARAMTLKEIPMRLSSGFGLHYREVL